MPKKEGKPKYKRYSLSFLPGVDDEFIDFIERRGIKKTFVDLYNNFKNMNKLEKLTDSLNAGEVSFNIKEYEFEIKNVIKSAIKENIKELVSKPISGSNETSSVDFDSEKIEELIEFALHKQEKFFKEKMESTNFLIEQYLERISQKTVENTNYNIDTLFSNLTNKFSEYFTKMGNPINQVSNNKSTEDDLGIKNSALAGGMKKFLTED